MGLMRMMQPVLALILKSKSDWHRNIREAS